MIDKFTDQSKRKAVELLPGITKKVMSYGDDSMICRFTMKQGAAIPLHSHKASQNGYVISGKVRLIGPEEKTTFIAGPGCGYYLEPHEVHGLEVLEDALIVETFSPLRPEYVAD